MQKKFKASEITLSNFSFEAVLRKNKIQIPELSSGALQIRFSKGATSGSLDNKGNG